MNIETKTCTKCGETKALDEFSKRQGKCKTCRNAACREHYKNNPEKERARCREWNRNNPEKVAAICREWVKNNPEKEAARHENYRKNNPEKNAASSREWRENNPDKSAASGKKWAKNNPGKVNALGAKYRASKLQRTPAWSETKEIEALYVEAQRLTKETGIQHHVDHRIPLQGDDVSGLHVYDNLQILTASENIAKSNKFAIG